MVCVSHPSQNEHSHQGGGHLLGAGKPQPGAHTEVPAQPEVGAQGRGSSSLVLVVRLSLVHHLHFTMGRKKGGRSIKCRSSTLRSTSEPQGAECESGHRSPTSSLQR